jgi:hypothetical protein
MNKKLSLSLKLRQIYPMKAFSVFLLVLASCLVCRAQANVLSGRSTNFGLQPNTNVQMVLEIIYPVNRTWNGNLVSDDPILAQESTSGYFSFTNILWGRYKLYANDGSGTAWTVTVPAGLSNTVPIASLIGSGKLPIDPATNYYTMSQIDSKLAVYSSSIISAGTGLTSTNVGGTNVLAVDSSVVTDATGVITLKNTGTIDGHSTNYTTIIGPDQWGTKLRLGTTANPNQVALENANGIFLLDENGDASVNGVSFASNGITSFASGKASISAAGNYIGNVGAGTNDHGVSVNQMISGTGATNSFQPTNAALSLLAANNGSALTGVQAANGVTAQDSNILSASVTNGGNATLGTVSATSFSGNGAGVTNQNAANLITNTWVNIKSFGSVKGDGIANDGPATQWFLNNYKNCTLFFPKGTYGIVTNGLVLTNANTLVGDNATFVGYYVTNIITITNCGSFSRQSISGFSFFGTVTNAISINGSASGSIIESAIENCYFGQDCNVFISADADAQVTCFSIKHNTFLLNKITVTNVSDTLIIEDNSFPNGLGTSVDMVPGAGGFVYSKNNYIGAAPALTVWRNLKPVIAANDIQCNAGATNQSWLMLNGTASVLVTDPIIENNLLNWDYCTNSIYLGYVTGAKIWKNTFTGYNSRTADSAITVSANATATSVGWNTLLGGNGLLLDHGAGTIRPDLAVIADANGAIPGNLLKGTVLSTTNGNVGVGLANATRRFQVLAPTFSVGAADEVLSVVSPAIGDESEGIFAVTETLTPSYGWLFKTWKENVGPFNAMSISNNGTVSVAALISSGTVTASGFAVGAQAGWSGTVAGIITNAVGPHGVSFQIGGGIITNVIAY